jgi:GAF domain-containing protein
LNDTVHLISDRFGFYHAGIFFTSEQAEAGMGYALLQAASSEGGQRMLKRQHKLNFGQGIVGTVAVTGQPRIALDVGGDAVYFNNPDLPLTHSEMALPLKMQNRVIGVLDVQSTEISAFHEEDIAILQILADQITLAIENARLLSESQKAFHELEEMYGSQIRRGWQKSLAGKPLAFALDARGITRLTEMVNPTAEEDGSSELGYSIQVPIELRGQQLGTLRLRRDKKEGPWTQQEINLLRETVSRLGLALENTRLMGEAQRSASREQQINLITAQVRSSASVESILKNTVRELGKSLGTAHAYIQIGSDDGQDSPAGQGADEPR